jgi:hypothetical protein
MRGERLPGIVTARIPTLRTHHIRPDRSTRPFRSIAETLLRPHLQPIDLKAVRIVGNEERTVCHEYAVAREAAGIARDTIWTKLNRLRIACHWAAKTGLIKGEWLAHNVWVPSQGQATQGTPSPVP